MIYRESVTIGHFYNFFFIKILRIFILLFLFIFIGINILNGGFPKIPIFILLWGFIVEIFFRYKLGRIKPKTIGEISPADSMRDTCSSVLLPVLSGHSTKKTIQKLIGIYKCHYLLEKMGIKNIEGVFIEIPEEDLLKKAYEFSKNCGGIYITTLDYLAAYLQLSEEQTHLLFSKNIKETDLQTILESIRIEFPNEELPRPGWHYNGMGIAEGLLFGWTPETQKYARDITRVALQEKPTAVGRESEFTQIIRTLSKTENNNVLLIGEAGSGKETLVKALAYQSHLSVIPQGVNGVRVYELLIGELIAGASDGSDLELRLEALIGEVTHAGNVILYIPDFENILGASSFKLNLSGALSPYLKSGTIPIIATMTVSSYKAFMENNPFREVFEIIQLKDLETPIVFKMLFAKSLFIEAKEQVIISYNAIKSALEFGHRYTDLAMPGSAVNLLIDTVAYIKTAQKPNVFGRKKLVESDDVVKIIEEKTHARVAKPSAEEKNLLLHLEEVLHQRIIDQTEAISAIAESIRRLRTGLTEYNKPVSFLFLGPTGVGKTETAKALADVYYNGEAHMIRFDMSEYSDASSITRLLGSAPGENDEKGELTEQVYDNPNSLLLLDEFEKSHQNIRDLFLQILDDGRITDNKGKTVSLVNMLIIATSNAGAELIREHVTTGGIIDKVFQQSLIDDLQKKLIFKPELLNRFDNIIIFKPLGITESKQIIELLLKNVTKKLFEQDITVVFDDKVKQKILTEGMNAEFGARPLRRYIQDTIEDKIAQKILKDEIQRGSAISISVDDQNNLAVL